VDFEGPDGGSVRVLFRWCPTPYVRGGYAWLPVAVEFGLFVTGAEADRLTLELQACRLAVLSRLEPPAAEAEARALPF